MNKIVINNILQNKNFLMFITALIFMSGILAYFNDNAVLYAGILTALSIILIVKNYIPLKYIILWLIIFYFGFFNAYFKTNVTDGLVPFAGEKAVIEGQVVSIPDISTKGKSKFFFITNKINGSAVSGKTLVTFTGDNASDFQIGSSYELSGRLRTPFKASNPSQFDYGKYLRNFNTFTVFYSDSSKQIDKKLSNKWKFIQNLNKLRDKIINVHAEYLKTPNIEILGGIVFGDDAIAPPDYIKTSFVNSGLLHILAASGMNVAFIYGFWVFFMRRLRVPFKFMVISGMGVIIIYTLMTGLGASVIRAALMLLFILAGKLIDRDANTVSLLAFVAMLMLIYNPAFINDVGFQLSFIVTFGLLTTANIIFERLKTSKIPQWLCGALLIPIIAQIWVAPIQMFYFNTFCTYSILANICSMPFLSVISFTGFVSSIIAMLAPLSDKLCMILDFILKYMLDILVFISDFFGSLPLSIITTTHPHILQILIYFSVVLLITLSFRIGFNKKILYSCSVLIMILMLSLINIPSKDLEIITFDVQNADCFLIKTPLNKYFIIDTGRAGYKGSKAQANSIIIKYLKDRGIKNIEGMIITHFDNDHSGGAVDIMKNLKVKHVYVNSFNDSSMTSVNIYKTLKDMNIPAKIPNYNKSIYSENNFNLQTYMANSEKDNEKSIITLLSYKDFDMLFTGDAGTDAFNVIKKDLPHNIEILKVGHHGGPKVVNQNMLEHLNTKISIISTGPNSFGHPNKGTLDILRNTEIYRTDRDNSIKINTDGINYKIYTYDAFKKKYMISNRFTAD